MDVGAYDTRGLYARAGWKESGLTRPAERFTRETWVERDICDRAPFPFSDGQFDFVVCCHTLEDWRDPAWVCSEINRIGKAGRRGPPRRAGGARARGTHMRTRRQTSLRRLAKRALRRRD